ncbi:MAG TPA: alpha/beta hydrolase-fold protein [Anaerolineae bacterium]
MSPTSSVYLTFAQKGLVVWLLWPLLVGCTIPGRPIPTLQPVAAVPLALSETDPDDPSIPPTYTPQPQATAPIVTPTPLPTATASPTPVPLPTLTPLPTLPPTSEVIPAFLSAEPANAAFLEQPPATTECSESGLLFRSQFPSAVGGPWRYYHAYLPPCYGQDGRAYAVLYLFHGSVQTDSHWADLGLVHHADRGIRDGRYPPFIAIMPFSGALGNSTSGGDGSIEGITVNALLPYVDETYCTWTEAAGRSLGGISRGGYWALMIAFRHSDLFAAVSGHSSHLRFETDGARYNPLATYAEADLSNMRIWLDWGERDFLWAGQQQLHRALTDAGVAHEAHVRGGGHNETYWMVHLQEYLDWHTAAWPRDRQAYPLCS